MCYIAHLGGPEIAQTNIEHTYNQNNDRSPKEAQPQIEFGEPRPGALTQKGNRLLTTCGLEGMLGRVELKKIEIHEEIQDVLRTDDHNNKEKTSDHDNDNSEKGIGDNEELKAMKV